MGTRWSRRANHDRRNGVRRTRSSSSAVSSAVWVGRGWEQPNRGAAPPWPTRGQTTRQLPGRPTRRESPRLAPIEVLERERERRRRSGPPPAPRFFRPGTIVHSFFQRLAPESFVLGFVFIFSSITQAFSSRAFSRAWLML